MAGGGSLDIYRPISASSISVFIAAWEKGDGEREGMEHINDNIEECQLRGLQVSQNLKKYLET